MHTLTTMMLLLAALARAPRTPAPARIAAIRAADATVEIIVPGGEAGEAPPYVEDAPTPAGAWSLPPQSAGAVPGGWSVSVARRHAARFYRAWRPAAAEPRF